METPIKIPRDPARLPREIVEAFTAGAKWRGDIALRFPRLIVQQMIQRAAMNYAWTGDPKNNDGP